MRMIWLFLTTALDNLALIVATNLHILSAFGANSISLICQPGAVIFQGCVLVPWFHLAAAALSGQQFA